MNCCNLKEVNMIFLFVTNSIGMMTPGLICNVIAHLCSQRHVPPINQLKTNNLEQMEIIPANNKHYEF